MSNSIKKYFFQRAEKNAANQNEGWEGTGRFPDLDWGNWRRGNKFNFEKKN